MHQGSCSLFGAQCTGPGVVVPQVPTGYRRRQAPTAERLPDRQQRVVTVQLAGFMAALAAAPVGTTLLVLEVGLLLPLGACRHAALIEDCYAFAQSSTLKKHANVHHNE